MAPPGFFLPGSRIPTSTVRRCKSLTVREKGSLETLLPGKAGPRAERDFGGGRKRRRAAGRNEDRSADRAASRTASASTKNDGPALRSADTGFPAPRRNASHRGRTAARLGPADTAGFAPTAGCAGRPRLRSRRVGLRQSPTQLAQPDQGEAVRPTATRTGPAAATSPATAADPCASGTLRKGAGGGRQRPSPAPALGRPEEHRGRAARPVAARPQARRRAGNGPTPDIQIVERLRNHPRYWIECDPGPAQ